jgi:hypothetical protein
VHSWLFSSINIGFRGLYSVIPPFGAVYIFRTYCGKTAKELIMKNTIKVFGIIAIVAVIGFSIAACGEEEESDSSTAGRLTITGLSSYNGRKIAVRNPYEFPLTTTNSLHGGPIDVTINGDSVTYYFWRRSGTNVKSYTGNDHMVFDVSIEIIPVGQIDGKVTVDFTKGVGSGAFVPD